ncbi:MAG: hypothetical protein LJE64_07670 [Desulfofustis sp.]|nr:hypothetical protein [Desulfofustis sp.]
MSGPDPSASHSGEILQQYRAEEFRLDPEWPDRYRRQGLCDEIVARFRSDVYRFYLNHGRRFSWRETISPYRVLVSEIMLQQTQTTRVAARFEPFVGAFPGFGELAAAPFSDVLRLWKGLGYNRRAKYLQDCARLVVSDFGGMLPDHPGILETFPGIGKATASSICVFAFNTPHPFIETNIRTVFIHLFFADHTRVADRDIMEIVERTLDADHPRRWFYALMDFGVMLKKRVGNAGRKSLHYQKQAPFAGSDRQLRGRILQLLLDHQYLEISSLCELLGQPDERLRPLVEALCLEGLAKQNQGTLSLS